MELRQYQIDAIKTIYEAWNSGSQNVLIQLATGGGKTTIFSHIVAQHPGSAIVIAHRVELVSQMSLALARNGIKHNIIARKDTIREIIAIHMLEVGTSYYNPQAKHVVAGIDTLIRLPVDTSWFKRIDLVVQDEAHHVLRKNKWGSVAELFPQALGLYPTATPVRADGNGLGRQADGIVDQLIVGVSMRDLIKQKYLTDYRIFAPPSDLDLTQVTISAGGDYSPPKLRSAVGKSHITGDVVAHYMRIAPGKLGVTFAVSIDAALEIAREFRAHDVRTEIVTSKTPALERTNIMRKFRNREVMQIVNVDILGEGVDVPAIECVSFARPTASYGLFVQQFGRALRPAPGKERAIIIDHVGNVLRHGLPDTPRVWSLDRQDRRARSTPTDVIPLRTCLNPECLGVYERVHRACPTCGYYTPPATRSDPKQVDGDLLELDEATLAKLRREIDRIDGAPPKLPHLDPYAQRGAANTHAARQQAQVELRAAIALYAGHLKTYAKQDSEIYRDFYFRFGVDIATAQTLGRSACEDLTGRIQGHIDKLSNTV